MPNPQELDLLKQEIAALNQRNAKVELDKKWETSVTRRVLLILFTYFAVALYFFAIGIQNPWINAVVPSMGFLLSTLSLPLFRKIWEKKRK